MNRPNSIRDVLNRGIFISFCLSLLVCGGVLIAWQLVSQVKSQTYNVSLVRGVLHRDASDLITSAMLKNYEAVAFQLKTTLNPLPIRCAYIELQGKRYALKGDLDTCIHASKNGESAEREIISSGGITLGPLVYLAEKQAFPGSALYLIFGFIGLIASVVLTWGVLLKMINDSILRPLRQLTSGLHGAAAGPDPRSACDEVVSLADQLSDFRTQVSASAKREEFVRLARMPIQVSQRLA